MRREDRNWEEDLRAALSAPASSVPEAALQAARHIFSAPPRRPGILAALRFDGRQGLVLARDGAPGSSFQRIFETETYLIDLWEERTAGNASYLIGQVYEKTTGATLPAEGVFLLASGTTRIARSEGAEWHAESVPAGQWSVQLWLESETLLLENIQVGA